MNEYPWSFKWIEHVLPLLSCFYGRHCAFDLWGSLREVGTIRRVFLSDWEMKWLICWKPETPKKNYWVQIMVRVITATRATLHQLFFEMRNFYPGWSHRYTMKRAGLFNTALRGGSTDSVKMACRNHRELVPHWLHGVKMSSSFHVCVKIDLRGYQDDKSCHRQGLLWKGLDTHSFREQHLWTCVVGFQVLPGCPNLINLF